LKIEGHNGQVEVFDDHLVLSHRGVLGFLTNGIKGDKTIPYSSITAVQFRDAGLWTNGYIQFSVKGGMENTGGLFAATADENTVMFRTGEQAERFARLKQLVESRMRTAAEPPRSHADELEKFAALRDRGIITNDEFEKKKRELLGL
jgi:hypothetical protein